MAGSLALARIAAAVSVGCSRARTDAPDTLHQECDIEGGEPNDRSHDETNARAQKKRFHV
jgi:hypothetical protein